MLIPETKINEVLDRTDIVSVIGRHVELKKAGRSYKGRCPFHNEKSTSFNVNPELRIFKCFGCQAGGDVIAFVRRHLGKSFVDAVRQLAADAGVELASSTKAPSAPGPIERALSRAAAHYQKNLWSLEANHVARTHLTARGITDETARRFGLGWAPAEFKSLTRELEQLTLVEAGLETGLLGKGTQSGDPHDFLRERLVVPFRDHTGQPIGFGGRTLIPSAADQNRPPYVVTKSTQRFRKSAALFGLDVARPHFTEKKQAIIMNNFVDCMLLHQAGISNAVAVSPGQIASDAFEPLRKLGVSEALIFSGRLSADTEALRLLTPILCAGLSGAIATPEEPQATVSAVTLKEATECESALARAQPLTEYVLDLLLPSGNDAAVEDKFIALGALKLRLQDVPESTAVSRLLDAVARHFGVPISEVENELRPRIRPATTR